MIDILIGDTVVDKGSSPHRIGIVVDVDDRFFTIKHLPKYLSFPAEHPFHTFSYDEHDEYLILRTLRNEGVLL